MIAENEIYLGIERARIYNGGCNLQILISFLHPFINGLLINHKECDLLYLRTSSSVIRTISFIISSDFINKKIIISD
jgi:hypothetical protein